MASLVTKKAKRGDTYHVDFCYPAYQRHRVKVGTSLVEAKRVRKRIEVTIDQIEAGNLTIPRGVDIKDFIVRGQTHARSTGGVTLADFVADYLDKAKPPAKAASTYTTEQIHLHHLLAFFATTPGITLPEVTPYHFEQYKSWRLAGGTGREVGTNTVNKELKSFSTVFKTAMQWGLCPANPLASVKRYTEVGTEERFRTMAEIHEILQAGDYSDQDIKELKRYRYLTVGEIEDLLKLLEIRDAKLAFAVAVLAQTGMRRGELLALQKKDVDLKRKLITVRSKKASRSERETSRTIDLTDGLAQLLDGQMRANSESRYVLVHEEERPFHKDEFQHRLKSALKGSDYEGIGFHCFRHSFASNLAAASVDPRQIDAWMGHQTEKMRKRYQHLFPARRRDAIKNIALGA